MFLNDETRRYYDSCSAGGPPPHPDDIYAPGPATRQGLERSKAMQAHDRAVVRAHDRKTPAAQ